ncbi:MAG: ABC transporter ATP-binding protein [Thermotogaceae bacterium]|nr:ABC transporter ATP-binding protein [Thermotogaceae bacterium]
MNLIEIRNVTKIYDLGDVKVNALRGINLEIKEGEILVIMGPSGSGKSTLLNLLGLLDKPTSGKIILAGKDVSSMNDNELAKMRNRFIGFIFQQFNLLPRMNAIENVELPMVYAGIPKKERTKRAKELLEKMGLENRMHHLPSQLSGGQQQRVAIARALANSPKLILADEPTGNLDSRSGDMIINILKELNKQGMTIVVVTHDSEIAKIGDRIVHIKDGKIHEIEVKE